MLIHDQVFAILSATLGLDGRENTFSDDTVLLGAIPELDSMTVLALINSLIEQFGFTIEDTELSAEIFATFGNLVAFVTAKIEETQP